MITGPVLSSQGGVKAVVYTDVIQTLVMFFGVLAVVVVVCRNLGGIEEVWEVAGQGGRLEFFKYVHLQLCVWFYILREERIINCSMDSVLLPRHQGQDL